LREVVAAASRSDSRANLPQHEPVEEVRDLLEHLLGAEEVAERLLVAPLEGSLEAPELGGG
jgi:hypothetical protein